MIAAKKSKFISSYGDDINSRLRILCTEFSVFLSKFEKQTREPFFLCLNILSTYNLPSNLQGINLKLSVNLPKEWKAEKGHQVLLGVTGSGKTFTVANVIKELNRPTLIISHNKTLAAQLYGEFKEFFPDNMVEYFISYYDYYQPEAYIASTNTYIEKDLSINQDIEKLRLRATTALASGRRDVIVVASVSCIYGIGAPEDFLSNIFYTNVGQQISQNQFLDRIVRLFYSRSQAKLEPGKFRVNGDTVDIYPAYDDWGIRIMFFGDEVERIQRFDPESGKSKEDMRDFTLYPANLFVTRRESLNTALVRNSGRFGGKGQPFRSSGYVSRSQSPQGTYRI